MALNYAALTTNSDYVVQLGLGVWLMDNQWALVAWEQQRFAGHRYVLLHADFHWDGVDDFGPSGSPREALLAAGLDELVAMTAAAEYIRFDSFIAPAVGRGLLSEVHFFCKEGDSNEVGLDADQCAQAVIEQVAHEDIESLARLDPVGPLIFDLCLDLFNHADDLEFEGDLLTDADVLGFLEAMSSLIRAATVVTISLSFGYSGTEEGARHVAQLVVPRIFK